MTARRMLDRTLRIAAVTAAILAAGCGGGGGGGSTPPPAPPQLIQITAQNQDAVARSTAATFFGMTGIRALPIAPSPSAKALSGAGDIALRALSKITAPAAGANAKVGRLDVYVDELACTLGGSIRLTIDDRDNNLTISRGDVLTVAFNQCRESADTLINGALVMGISSASETPTTLQMSGTFEYQNLTVIEGGYTSSVHGVMDSTYSESVDPMGTLTTQMTSTVAASGLVASGSTPVLTDTFTYDPGFAMVSMDVEPATPTPPAFSTVALNGTVHVASLGGRITLVTDPMLPVRDTWGEPYPSSGQVTVLGRDSRLRLTVLNVERVRLELDANNDGTFEATKELLWTELLP